jgi:hypothetical protein
MVKEDILLQDIIFVIGRKLIIHTPDNDAGSTQHDELLSSASHNVRSSLQSRLQQPDACYQNSTLVCALLLSTLDVSMGFSLYL